MMEKSEGFPSKQASRRTHMANERTFLAWVRTAIGIMAFGYAIERLVFFDSQQSIPSQRLSQLPGLLLLAFGVVITALAYLRYRTIEREIDKGMYKPNMLFTTTLTFFVIGVGILLLVYLIRIV